MIEYHCCPWRKTVSNRDVRIANLYKRANDCGLTEQTAWWLHEDINGELTSLRSGGRRGNRSWDRAQLRLLRADIAFRFNFPKGRGW